MSKHKDRGAPVQDRLVAGLIEETAAPAGHGHGRRRGRGRKPVPGKLLARVAAALNACEAAGLTVKLKHGAVITRTGYVLPGAGGWVARTLAYTEFPAPADPHDEDD